VNWIDPPLRARIAAMFDRHDWKTGSVGERISLIEALITQKRHEEVANPPGIEERAQAWTRCIWNDPDDELPKARAMLLEVRAEALRESADEIAKLRRRLRRQTFRLGEACPFCGFDQPQCDCSTPMPGEAKEGT